MSAASTKQKPRFSKKAYEGQRIWKRIIQRNPDEGGVFMEVTGIQGSGKTSLLHKIGQVITDKYHNELVFWRDAFQSPVQFNRVDNWNMLVQQGLDIVVRNISTKEPIELSYTTFTDFDDLLDKAKLGMLNAVFFEHEDRWIDFIKFCRMIGGWQTILIDEYEDIFPQRSRGEQWQKNEWAANNMKNIRKGLVNVIGCSQSISDVDYRIRTKLMIWGYLFGAEVDRRSPVFQHAVSSIPLGEAWLDWGHSIFGQIRFPPFPPRNPVVEVEVLDAYSH